VAFRDLQSKRLIIVKGVLFLLLACGAGVWVVVESGAWWRRMLLLVICVWAFCRAYYFAFYVIERYVDPNYRFSGLFSAIRFLLRPTGQHRTSKDHPDRSG